MCWGVAISIVVGLGHEARAQTAPTRANIISTDARQWDVLVDGQLVCSTPCVGPLFPQQLVLLQSQEARPVLLQVGNLPAGDLIVSAKPHQAGRYALGIVATTLGGMALAVGITFFSVGLAKDRGGMTTAGLITGAAGALMLPGGLYLMMTAVPSVTVDRTDPSMGGIATVGATF